MKTKVTSTVPTPANLRRAANILERLTEKRKGIAVLEAEYSALIGNTISSGNVPPVGYTSSGKVKRTMSAATKAKIAAGQAKRWANAKSATVATPTPATPAATAAAVKSSTGLAAV